MSHQAPSSQAIITVRVTDWADPIGAALRARQLEEIRKDIEGETDAGTAPSEHDIQVFVLLEMDGVAIACGGLRDTSSSAPPPSAAASASASSTLPSSLIPQPTDRAAEVKRMFVAPEFRGNAMGVTNRLMHELEREATERGFTTLKLATGEQMLRARAFYERQGFRPVGLFVPYLSTGATICYAKTLVA